METTRLGQVMPFPEDTPIHVWPVLSVVVPTKGRTREVGSLLRSVVGAADNVPGEVEIIVVDDSEPSDQEKLLRMCAQWGARYIPGPRLVGAKRNLGVRVARADIVLFLDSDTLATKDLLACHVKGLNKVDSDTLAAVAGPTVTEQTTSVLNRAMRLSSWFEDLEWPGHARELGWATTSNLAVRRHLFLQVGGFHEQPLTVVAGEDVEFGLRLTDAGYRITCNKEAWAVHDRESSDGVVRVARRLFNYGRSGQWLCTVFPQRRRWRVNRVVLSALSLLLCSQVKARPIHRSTLAVVPLAVATIWHALSNRKRHEGSCLKLCFLASIMELAAEAGEVAGAIQLKSPSLVLRGFDWTGSLAFKW